jgi:hypothetical protein
MFARSLSQTLKAKTIEVPLSSGDMFKGNGVVTRIPRGEVDAVFIPRRGTVNNTVVHPPIPAKVPLKVFRVPKGVGATLVFDYLQWLADSKAVETLERMGQVANEIRLERTIKQDAELMEQTLIAAQIKPQESAARLLTKCMTRTASRAARKTTRIRGWSRR